MAKKEEKNIRKEENDSTRNSGKEKDISKKSPKKPLKSGKVKGPKGVGEKEPSEGKPSKKASPKNAKTDATSKEKKKPAAKTRKKATTKASGPAVKKQTKKEETSEENHVSSVEKSAKIKAPFIKDDPVPAPDSEARESEKKEAIKKEKEAEGSKEKKTAPKKMTRRNADPEISAEAKMKLPNTSASEDLKKSASAATESFKDKVSEDKKGLPNIEKIAKGILPDPEKAAEMAKKVADKVLPDPETVKNVLDKIVPEDDNKNDLSSEKTNEPTLFSSFDIHLFREGKHFQLYQKLGSHLMEFQGKKGVYFAVWAPNAKEVSVMGDFNEWNKEIHQMKPRSDESGIWELFIPEAKNGSLYKYFIRSNSGYEAEKGDPYAFLWETPPNTASVVWDLKNTWDDSEWMEQRKNTSQSTKPVSVYELHLGSWKRVPEENSRSLTYRELAAQLPEYIKEMGFTHIEFMPVMEHPFFGSWGYQITGYFAPSSRFGTPQDFMFLIQELHKAGIGVILDWVPSHFPGDLHGLHYFDGTFLYEHADPRKGFHPDWQSYIFNYGRNEIRSFLISNALFWLDKFHVDGLRVDAVASMLYLNYSRKEGEWEPNKEGGRENLEAISFLKEFNEVVYSEFPDTITIAEESTAWPMVSKPTFMGGLGFGMKWMMGWMHDTLEYFKKDPIHRKFHQNVITFSTNYAFSENFMLPLSHDEVVYGKEALINKMPGDSWNKFANLRSLYAYMFAHPGTKLLFMGGEFAQTSEWNHDSSLDWHLTQEPYHDQLQEFVKELNKLYKEEPALYEKPFDPEGFEWIDIQDSANSVISFIRKGNNPEDTILAIGNFTPVARENYRIGVPEAGTWQEILNSDLDKFGGSNAKNPTGIESENIAVHHKENSISLLLPPMAVVYLKKAP